MTAKATEPTPVAEGIVVEGYSDRFAAAVRHVLAVEGGYSNDQADRGGATQFGISLRFLVSEGSFDEDQDGFADFDLDMDGDIDGEDIRQLTPGDAIYLYHRCFWLRAGAESFPAPIGEMMFDQAVNGGIAPSRKLLQRAINIVIREQRYRTIRLVADGVIGPRTRELFEAMHRRHPVELAEAYRSAAKDRYFAIVRRFPSQGKFLQGWLNRADRLGRA
ncbi:MAG: hypothetical protein KUG65_05995 [Sphingomonadaceae bacterium]|nr:hypothetical protein [Sphingomonadaceae bacterium]